LPSSIVCKLPLMICNTVLVTTGVVLAWF